MKAARRIHPRDLMGAFAVAMICAIAIAVALATIATPSGFKSRLSDLSANYDVVAQLARPRVATEPLAQGVVCVGPASQATAAIAQSIKAVGAQAQMQISKLDIAATGEFSRGKLAPIRVRIEAQGNYDGAVLMLDQIGKQRPRIFVQTVDLTSKGQATALSFTGRAFCAD